MNERPSDEKLKTPRMFAGKPWHFCHPDTGGKCKGVCCCHKPQDCNGTARRKKGKGHTKANKEKQKPKVTFNEALSSLDTSEEE